MKQQCVIRYTITTDNSLLQFIHVFDAYRSGVGFSSDAALRFAGLWQDF